MNVQEPGDKQEYSKIALLITNIDDYCINNQFFFSENFRNLLLNFLSSNDIKDISVSMIVNDGYHCILPIMNEVISYKRPSEEEVLRLSEIVMSPNQKKSITSSEAVKLKLLPGDYHRTIRKYGLKYGVVFSNRKFRIAFHKGVDKEDFTSNEIHYLNLISDAILSKYNSHIRLNQIISAKEMKDSLIEDMKIGIVTFDNKYNLLDCSNIAVDFMTNFMGHGDFISGKKALEELLEDEIEMRLRAPQKIKLDGYLLTINFITKQDKFNCMTHIYRVIIEDLKGDSARKKDDIDKQAFNEYKLSKRELEIIKLLNKGNGNEEISKLLYISTSTLRTHLKNIYRKMDVHNLSQLLNVYNNTIANLDNEE